MSPFRSLATLETRPSPPLDRLAALGAFLLPLVILIERGWARLAAPDFWAEDGKVFFEQALHEGVRSLLHPMAGSYFTIERLVMVGAVALAPLVWVPFLVCLTAIVITAFVMSRIVDDAYAWLVPSRSVRLGAACAFCLLPGLYEMLGNLCNVNWVLFAGAALIGLQDPKRTLTRTNLVVTALVAVSVGTAVLLIPLFVWRLASGVAQHAGRRRLTADLGAIAILVLLGGVLPALFGGSQPSTPTGIGAVDLAKVWYDHIARLVVFTPWIGDRLTIAMSTWHPTGLYRIAKIAFVFFLLTWAWRHRRDARAHAMLALLAGVSVWTVLSSLTRVYAFDLLQHQTGTWFYECRYSFIMSFVGLLFWLVVLQGADRLRVPAVAAGLAFLALNGALAAHRFNIDAYNNPRFHARVVGSTVVAIPVTDYRIDAPSRTHWQDGYPELARARETGCPQHVTVLQYPDPWAYTYDVPPPVKVCP